MMVEAQVWLQLGESLLEHCVYDKVAAGHEHPCVSLDELTI